MEKRSDNESVNNCFAYILNDIDNEEALKMIFLEALTTEAEKIKINIPFLNIFISGNNRPKIYAKSSNYRSTRKSQTLKTDYRETWFRYVFKKEKPTPNASTIGLTNFAGLYDYENAAEEIETDRADIKPNSLFEKEIYVLNFLQNYAAK